MRGVLESRRVHHQDEITRRVITPDRREVSVAGLIQSLARVWRYDDTVRASRYGFDQRAELVLARRGISALHEHWERVARREARELVQGQAEVTHNGERYAAVEHLLVVPAPGSFPHAVRIDLRKRKWNKQDFWSFNHFESLSSHIILLLRHIKCWRRELKIIYQTISTSGPKKCWAMLYCRSVGINDCINYLKLWNR